MNGWLDIHTKVKAAMLTLLGLGAADVGAFAHGDVDARGAVALFVAGALPVLASYLKSGYTSTEG